MVTKTQSDALQSQKNIMRDLSILAVQPEYCELKPFIDEFLGKARSIHEQCVRKINDPNVTIDIPQPNKFYTDNFNSIYVTGKSETTQKREAVSLFINNFANSIVHIAGKEFLQTEKNNLRELGRKVKQENANVVSDDSVVEKELSTFIQNAINDLEENPTPEVEALKIITAMLNSIPEDGRSIEERDILKACEEKVGQKIENQAQMEFDWEPFVQQIKIIAGKDTTFLNRQLNALIKIAAQYDLGDEPDEYNQQVIEYLNAVIVPEETTLGDNIDFPPDYDAPPPPAEELLLEKKKKLLRDMYSVFISLDDNTEGEYKFALMTIYGDCLPLAGIKNGNDEFFKTLPKPNANEPLTLGNLATFFNAVRDLTGEYSSQVRASEKVANDWRAAQFKENTSNVEIPQKDDTKFGQKIKNKAWAIFYKSYPCFIINASAFDDPTFAARLAALIKARPEAFFGIVAKTENNKEMIAAELDKHFKKNPFRFNASYPIIVEETIEKVGIQKAIDGFGLKKDHKGEIDLIGFGEEINIDGFKTETKKIAVCFPPALAITSMNPPELFLVKEAELEEKFAELVNKIQRKHYVVIVANNGNVDAVTERANKLFLENNYPRLFASITDDKNSHCNVMTSAEVDAIVSKNKNPKTPAYFKDFGFKLNRTPHNMRQPSAVKITGAVNWDTLVKKLPAFAVEQKLTYNLPDQKNTNLVRFVSNDANRPISPIIVKQETDGCFLNTGDASEEATQQILIKLALEIAKETPDAEIIIEAKDPTIRAQIEAALKKAAPTVNCRTEAAADNLENNLFKPSSLVF